MHLLVWNWPPVKWDSFKWAMLFKYISFLELKMDTQSLLSDVKNNKSSTLMLVGLSQYLNKYHYWCNVQYQFDL